MHWIFNRFLLMGPAEAAAAAGGAVVEDRGDDFTPTGDDAIDAPGKDEPAAKKLADELEAEKKAKDEAKDEEKTEVEDKTEAKDEEKDKAEAAKKKDDRIPAARHKEILEKERERSRTERETLERELARYREGDKIANTNEEIDRAEKDLVKLEDDYAKQITDGEAGKAAQTMAQIRKLERSIGEAKQTVQIQAAEARAVERVRYDMTVERLEDAYPILNPDHEDFDKEKTGELLEMKNGFQLQGYTPSAALQKAVKYVFPPETKKQAEATEVSPRVDKDDVAKARKDSAAKKTNDAVEKQPPSTNKVGLDSDKLGGGIDAKSVMKMSYDEFSKLDEETLSRLRGDVNV